MKKFLILFVSALLVLGCSQARAEMTSPSYDGTYRSLQTYSMVYNGTGRAISSNTVVIADTTWSAFDGTNFGTYATNSAATASVGVLGVTDEDIASGSIGRIVIRGPHQVKVATTDSNSVYHPNETGDILVTSPGSLNGMNTGEDISRGGVIKASMTAAFVIDIANDTFGSVGYRLGTGTTNPATNSTSDLIWMWVEPQTHQISGPQS